MLGERKHDINAAQSKISTMRLVTQKDKNEK